MAFGKTPRLYKVPKGNGIMYAGTQDLSCWMLPAPDAKEKKKYTIDFKTGKKPANGKPYPEWALQTSAYRNADDNDGNGIVLLDKESGQPTWFDLSETYEQDLERFKWLTMYWRATFPEHLAKGAPSATTICGVLDKPALMYWSVNCAIDYIRDEIEKPQELSWEMALLPILEAARKEWRKVSRKAMDIGTMVHDAIEQYIKHGLEPRKDVPDEVLSGFVAFLEWYEKHQVEPIDTEKAVYGRFD